MNIFVILILAASSLVAFQILAWLNGEYDGDSYENYREELRHRLVPKRPNTAASAMQYWTRLSFYSFYIWPFRVLIVNLIVIFINLEMNHCFLGTH